MASAGLSRRVERVVGYPPLSAMSELQRREFHEALVDADTFEDLPGKWQAAILKPSRTGLNCGSSPATDSPTQHRRSRGSRSGWPYEKRRELAGVGSSAQLRPWERATAPALRREGG
jgi:hypothetical protein